MRRLALLPVVALLAALLAGCGGSAPARKHAMVAVAQTTQATTATTPHAPNGDIYDWLPHLYDRVSPQVVAILVQQANAAGEGSGVIWSSDGYIVTDDHVVAGAQSIEVALATGERVPAKVVGTDTQTDLAVIKIDKTGLPTAQFAENLPHVGQLAAAIGSPLGFQGSFTQGIVSGLHRNLPSGQGQLPLVDLIQTDAPISPGNSGGALVNEYGVVVGINEAYIPPSQGAVAIGFATPAPTVTSVVRQLIKTGHAEHAFLGIQAGDITPGLAQQYHLSVGSGVLVLDLVNGSPAAKAGLQPGDVIVELGGQKLQSAADLLDALSNRKPGDSVQLTIVRNGARKQVQVTLSSRPSA